MASATLSENIEFQSWNTEKEVSKLNAGDIIVTVKLNTEATAAATATATATPQVKWEISPPNPNFTITASNANNKIASVKLNNTTVEDELTFTIKATDINNKVYTKSVIFPESETKTDDEEGEDNEEATVTVTNNPEMTFFYLKNQTPETDACLTEKNGFKKTPKADNKYKAQRT